MLYILDSNVLIDANRDYYPLNRVPEFWEWLEYMGLKGYVKIPIEMFEELKEGKDKLSEWAKNPDVLNVLLLNEDADFNLVSHVIDEGYANDLNDEEIEKIGRDPFLLAYALSYNNRCVVTTETSKPKRKRANRHIPDVCNDLNIKWCNTFEFLRNLDFKTNWNRI